MWGWVPARHVILGKGDSGPLVLALQQDLLKLGLQLPAYGADSDVGDETVAAVKAFQESVGFTGEDVDGEVGPKTRAALDVVLKAVK
jgi:peptidoglycan hydrolase-like protein with peptidoglycan-binding domain